MPPLDVLLLIEDSTADILITERLIRKVIPHVNLIVRKAAETALVYLSETPVLPQLILLDLTLPGMDGITFIDRVRRVNKLRPIPIVILTGAAVDVARASAKNVDGYILKVIKQEDFVKEFQELIIKLGFEG